MLDLAATEFQNETINSLEDIVHCHKGLQRKQTDRPLRLKAYLCWHEIKGIASLFEFNEIASLSHAIESILDLNNGQRKITKEHLFLFEKAENYIKKYIESKIYTQPLLEDASVLISDLRELSKMKSGSSKSDSPAAPFSSQHKILVIDDEPTNHTLLEAVIHSVNGQIEVTVVDSAEEGLYHFFNNQYDIIFLDIMMPVIDGNDFIAIIEKNLQLKNITSPCNIVVQTAIQSISQLMNLAKAECVQEIIKKPINTARIKECIDRYCLDPDE